MPSPSSPDSTSETEKQRPRTLAEFFMDCPPQTLWQLGSHGNLQPSFRPDSYDIIFPIIQLFCAGDCDCVMNFAASDTDMSTTLREGKTVDLFVEYRCRNCGTESKTFAVTFAISKGDGFFAIKYGEFPPFGPRLPGRLQRLFQGDVELLKKGFRAEKWGFGVAAFTYYRQVIESQRDRLFDRIIAAAKAVKAPQPEIDRLEKNQKQQTVFHLPQRSEGGISAKFNGRRSKSNGDFASSVQRSYT